MEECRKQSTLVPIRHRDRRKMVRANLVEASSLEERVQVIARAKSKDVGDLDESAGLS